MAYELKPLRRLRHFAEDAEENLFFAFLCENSVSSAVDHVFTAFELVSIQIEFASSGGLRVSNDRKKMYIAQHSIANGGKPR